MQTQTESKENMTVMDELIPYDSRIIFISLYIDHKRQKYAKMFL